MLISPLDPQRPADWRWQLVRQAETILSVSDDAQLMRRYLRSDRYLKLAQKARLRLRKEQEKFERGMFRGRIVMPGAVPNDVQLVERALTLTIQNPHYSDYWLVKALLLGRAPTFLVSQLVGESTDFLSVLKEVFFDVEDRLEDENFIWSQVIGTYPTKGLYENELEAVWQECGYLGGYERMFQLSANKIPHDPLGQYKDVWIKRPILQHYRQPGVVSAAVQDVVKRRMMPAPNRTIANLRQLYCSLPGSSPEKLAAMVKTHQEEVVVTSYFGTNRAGKLERRPAELLIPSKRQPVPRSIQEPF